MTRRTYETPAIRVHWNSARCIHTAICLNALPEVFDVRRRPWIDVQAADADSIAAAIERCPTGALTYDRLDGAEGEPVADPPTVVPWPNGPLMVRGRVEVRDARGESFEVAPRMTLCRCGHSRNQPFCDLSHREADFADVPLADPAGRATAESPAEITADPAS